MRTIHHPILIFNNLNVVAFDAHGQQIATLQKSLASLYAEHMKRCGYDPEGVILETQWGSAWRLFKTKHGWKHECVNVTTDTKEGGAK